MIHVIDAPHGEWKEITREDVSDPGAFCELSRTGVGYQAKAEFSDGAPVRYFALIGSSKPEVFYKSPENAEAKRYPLTECVHRVVLKIDYQDRNGVPSMVGAIVVANHNIDPFPRFSADIEVLNKELGVSLNEGHYPYPRRPEPYVYVSDSDGAPVEEFAGP